MEVTKLQAAGMTILVLWGTLMICFILTSLATRALINDKPGRAETWCSLARGIIPLGTAIAAYALTLIQI